MSSKASIRNNEIHYLVNQIHNVRDELMERAYSKYLGDDPEPKTKDEMQKRIADGMFTVESFFEDGRHPCIHWRSPDKKKDYAGYEKTKENIDQAFQTARDAANVLPAPDALNELKKFKEFQV